MPPLDSECRRCGEVGEFYSGCRVCKTCKIRENSLRKRKGNKYGSRAEYRATLRAKAVTPEERKEQQRQYRLSNLAYYSERAMHRKASKLEATPNWLTEDQQWMIDEIYDLRVQRQEATGVEHHVDHIVPLLGVMARGLHVPWNLQVIPAELNLRKSNTVGF